MLSEEAERILGLKKLVAKIRSSSKGCVSKSWYTIDGEKYLVKGNSLKEEGACYEPYSEVLAACVADVLRLDHVVYRLDDAYLYPDVKMYEIQHVSLCKAIGLEEDEQLLSFKSIVKTEDCHTFWECMGAYRTLGLPDEDMYRMLVFDAVIGNEDRHLNNWDYIVSPKGIRPAPLFDHGASFRAMVPEKCLGTGGMFYPDRASSFDGTHTLILQNIREEFSGKLFNVEYKELDNKFYTCLDSISSYLSVKRVKEISEYFDARVDTYLSLFA